jgi:anti-anti-sigma factor
VQPPIGVPRRDDTTRRHGPLRRLRGLRPSAFGDEPTPRRDAGDPFVKTPTQTTEPLHRVVCGSGCHATVHIRGDLDAGAAAALEREVGELIGLGAHAITIDLEHLAFVDRVGDQVVADATVRLARLGGHLILVRRPG